MEFRQLEVFVCLVGNESFSLTAKELGVSQPTVSFNLKQLEEELNSPLFIRTTRELRLTSEGRMLYEEAKIVLSFRERIMDSFVRKKNKRITIGVSTISGSYILPDVLDEFRKDYPDIQIDIIETNSLQTIKKVSDYEVDLGIVGMIRENDICEFKPIFEDEFVFVCPNTKYYKDLRNTKPTIKRLAKEPIISRESGSGIKKNMDSLLIAAGVDIEDLNIAISINDEELVKLVTMGMGTTFISKVAVQDLVKTGKAISISLDDYPERFRNLYLVWNKKVTLPNHVEDFIKYIIK